VRVSMAWSSSCRKSDMIKNNRPLGLLCLRVIGGGGVMALPPWQGSYEGAEPPLSLTSNHAASSKTK
jgi:hypothetical protein